MVVVAVGSTLLAAVEMVVPVVSVCVKDGGFPGRVDVDDNDAQGDVGEDEVAVAGCRGAF